MTKTRDLFSDLQLSAVESSTFDALQAAWSQAKQEVKEAEQLQLRPRTIVVGLFSLACLGLSVGLDASPDSIASIGLLGTIAQLSSTQWEKHCIKQLALAVQKEAKAKKAFQAYSRKLSEL